MHTKLFAKETNPRNVESFNHDVEFWRDMEKTSIKNALSSRNEGAAKLQTLVTWLWGITTGSSLVGVAYKLASGGANPEWNTANILIGVSSILLVTTYWLCVRAQFPIELSFADPDTPEGLAKIREQFESALKIKNRWLHWAVFVSAAATLSVSLSLLLHFADK